MGEGEKFPLIISKSNEWKYVGIKNDVWLNK